MSCFYGFGTLFSKAIKFQSNNETVSTLNQKQGRLFISYLIISKMLLALYTCKNNCIPCMWRKPQYGRSLVDTDVPRINNLKLFVLGQYYLKLFKKGFNMAIRV